MSTIIQQEGGLIPDRDEKSGTLTPLVFTLDGVAYGDDPTQDPLIPQPQSQRNIGGKVYTCDRVYAEAIRTGPHGSTSSYTVTCLFSTDGRFKWPTMPLPISADSRGFTMTPKLVEQPIPNFKRVPYEYATGVALDWVRDDKTISLEYSLLSITVHLLDLSNPQIIQAIAKARAQQGHMHIFPAFEGVRWVMQSPTITQDANVLTISYSWESDPGNGPWQNPSDSSLDDPNDPALYIPAPARAGFWQYVPMEAQARGENPSIQVQDTIPELDINGERNPFHDPDGWANLPGNPI